MYKLVRRILNGRVLVGYIVSDGKELRQLSLEETKYLVQVHCIQDVEYDYRKQKIVGKSIDLRSIKSVQISELNKNKLENNKVYYKLIGSGKTAGIIRAVDIYNLHIKNIQCDYLIVYHPEKAVCCPHIEIDVKSVKIQHIVLVNISQSLFDMLGMQDVKQFIDGLTAINYIKSDGFGSIQSKSVANPGYKTTNTNWYGAKASDCGFIYDYREFIDDNCLDLTTYMSKLYNDEAVRQIANGNIQLRSNLYNSNEILTFQKFEKQLKTMNDNSDFQLMAFRLDQNTVKQSDSYPDALVDLDISLIDDIVKSCKDADIISKLMLPNTQVFRIIGKKEVYDCTKLREHTIKYANKLNRLHDVQYWKNRGAITKDDYTFSILDYSEIAKLVYPLESKLKLLAQGSDCGNLGNTEQSQRMQNLLASKIFRYLLELYGRNRNLEQFMSDLLIELIIKYLKPTEICIDNKLKFRYTGMNKLGVESFNILNYEIELYSIDALLDNPDISVFVTDADSMLGTRADMSSDCMITQQGRKIYQFDFNDYNFVNLRRLDNMFFSIRLKKLVIDGAYLPRVESMDGMLSGATIDEVVIKNMNFKKCKSCYGFFTDFRGKLLIFNQIINDMTPGYVESFREYSLLVNNNGWAKVYEFITDDPVLKYHRLNENRKVQDAYTNGFIWKSYDSRLLNYGESTAKQRKDYIDIKQNEKYC